MNPAVELSLIMLSSGIGSYFALRGMAYVICPPKEYFEDYRRKVK